MTDCQVQQQGPLLFTELRSPFFDRVRTEERLTIILLHGFGVSGLDLYWIGRELLEGTLGARPVRFVFPIGPLELTPSPDPRASLRAWFPIDMLRFQIAVQQGQLDALESYTPAGLDEASQLLDEFLTRLADNGSAPMQLIVGGFSQGALVATDWLLRSQVTPRALLLLSAILINRDAWLKALTTKVGLPVLQTHAPTDPVLPFALAGRLAEAMKGARLEHQFRESPGAHFVAHALLPSLATFFEENAPWTRLEPNPFKPPCA